LVVKGSDLIRQSSVRVFELDDLSVGIVQSNSEIVDLDSCRVQLGGEVVHCSIQMGNLVCEGNIG
jgi:hypothetical protein